MIREGFIQAIDNMYKLYNESEINQATPHGPNIFWMMIMMTMRRLSFYTDFNKRDHYHQ